MKKSVLNRIVITLVICVFSTLYACNPAQSAINDLSDLTEELEQNSDSFTDEDWNKIAEEYEAIETELSKHEYTNEELKEIGRMKGKCIGIMTKKAFQEFGEQMEDFSTQLEGAVEGFMESFDENFFDEDSTREE